MVIMGKQAKGPSRMKVLAVLFVMIYYGPFATASMLPPLLTSFTNGDISNHRKIISDSFKNSPFGLKCPGSAGVSYEWFKNDLPVEEGSGLVVSGQHLDFEPNLNHEGFYFCVASNQFGKAKSEVIWLASEEPAQPDWAVAPVFTMEPEVGVIEVGSKTAFKCDAEGYPQPEIAWTKNGQVLPELNDLKELSIERVETSDVATYACNASNSVGYVYKVVYLTILNQVPEFTETPDNRTVSVGQEAILRCNAKGHPKPEITWEYGTEGNHENYEITEDFDLKISRVKQEDQGVFTCKISNELGAKSYDGYLKVVSTTTIVKGPADTKAEISKSVTLPCEVISDPKYKLTIAWKKDNVDVAPDGTKIIQDPSDHWLLINELTFEDSGVYTCVASSSTESATTGTVTDSGTLQVTGNPPTLVRGPTAMTIANGVEVEIHCTVEGFPKPEHTWYKNGERISLDDNRSKETISVKEDGSLHITVVSLEDSGEYQCRAENGYGTPVVASANVDVRKRTRVLKAPDHVVYEAGGDLTFDCLVEVDEKLQESVVIEWFKDEEKLDLSDASKESGTSRMIIHSNNSLTIKAAVEEDLGTYTCKVKTGIDDVVMTATLYPEFGWLWLIILIVVIFALLLVIICLLCIVYIRRRSKKKGRYGVKDMEDGKRKKSGKPESTDIQYSIDDEEESLHKPLSNNHANANAGKNGNAVPVNRTSTPNKKGFAKMKSGANEASGSKNSLLELAEEDEWLRKGMEEDGSFRGNYAN